MTDRNVLNEKAKMVFAEYFKTARKVAKKTQAQFASQLLITDRQYRNIENGHEAPSAVTLALFLSLLTEYEQKTLLDDIRKVMEERN